VLGLPVDKFDESKGWVKIEIPTTQTNGVGSGSVLNSSLLGAGVKDGSVIGFKFVPAGEDENSVEWDVVFPTYQEDDGQLADGTL
jgi:hypothetical protein